MKTLKQFVEQTGYLKTKSPDEQKFVDKHVSVTKADPAGNGDDVFKAANIKKVDRKKDRKGYDSGDDEKVYEEADLEEKTLTPAEIKKREEIAKAIKRENPKMPMAKKMAIATATAKKVAEDFEVAISDLPSRTKDLLESTMGRLSEENKFKFVAACQTEEGLEKMVAFAIENRGA